MKIILKIIGAILVVLIVGFYIVMNHSTREKLHLVCKGSWFTKGEKYQDEKIFFRFERWRWWVNLWNDSDGNVHIQHEDGKLGYLPHIQFVNGWNDIVLDKGIGIENGRYSGLSKKMRYRVVDHLFEGDCTETDK